MPGRYFPRAAGEPLRGGRWATRPDPYWLTCTTFAGGKPLNHVDDALE